MDNAGDIMGISTAALRRWVGSVIVVMGLLSFIVAFVMSVWKGQAVHVAADRYLLSAKDVNCNSFNAWDVRCWNAWSFAKQFSSENQKKDENYNPNTPSVFKLLNYARLCTLESLDNIRAQFILFVSSFLLFVIGCGFVLTGYGAGLFVDVNTNYMSLSKTQAILWGALLLGGYSSLLSFDIGFGVGFANVSTGLVPFPVMDKELWGLLGIATGSPMWAAYITKERSVGNLKIKYRSNISQARWFDLLTGPDKEYKDNPSLVRIQCVYVTMMLILYYFFCVWDLVRVVDLERLEFAIKQKNVMYKTMPHVDTTFLMLLGSSHAIFQVSKTLLAEKYLGKNK